MKQTDTKPDDESAFEELGFEELVRRNGSAWVVDQLQNLGGPQLVLLHLANSLSDDPSDSRVLFELIEKFEEPARVGRKS